MSTHTNIRQTKVTLPVTLSQLNHSTDFLEIWLGDILIEEVHRILFTAITDIRASIHKSR